MSQVVSLRLPDETLAKLKQTARKSGRSLSEVGALSIEEWLRQNEFSDIEFRTVSGERHACVKGALPVWQLILIAKEYGMDAKKTAGHFVWPPHKVQAGLNYYEAYPGEIDQAIDDNRSMTVDKLRRMLPGLEVFTVPSKAARRRK